MIGKALHGFGAGPVRQIAFVVEDLDRAARDWSVQLGIGPFFCLRHVGLDAVRYRGADATLDISVALSFSGDLCVELIEQHNEGPSPYRDVVPSGGSGFHHVLIYPDDYDAAIARCADDGLEVAGSGVLRSSGMRFAYIDTRALLGIMVELASIETPEQWAPLKQACLAWRPGDGVIAELARLGS